MNIYEHKPVLENDVFLIREIQNSDFEDLFSVYSDKNAFLILTATTVTETFFTIQPEKR